MTPASFRGSRIASILARSFIDNEKGVYLRSLILTPGLNRISISIPLLNLLSSRRKR
jgi:hypothetical protein